MNKLRINAFLVLALTVVLCAQAVNGAQASVSRSSSGASTDALAIVAGGLPIAASPSAPARVYLFGEPDPSHPTVGQVLPEPVLASAEVTQGRSFRLAVPRSATAQKLMLPGSRTLNVRVVAVSTRGTSSWFTPAETRPAGGDVAAPMVKVGTLPAYDLAALHNAAAIQGVTPSALVACVHDCTNCVWKDVKNKDNYTTRIGELHAAKGMTATYSYWNKADSTFTVGFEAVGDDGWSSDGTAGVTKDSGTGAGVPRNGYFSRYFEGKYDYAKLQQRVGKGGGDCATAGNLKQNATEWDGTIEPGSKTHGRKNNSCQGAVNYVSIPGHGSSNWKENGNSYFWKVGVASPMGFSFGDRTGYSAHTKEIWKSRRSGRSYLCGPRNDTSHFNQWTIVYNYNSR